MKFKLTIATLFTIGAFIISPSPAQAQDSEPVVVDEVIAQVNEGVITLSQVKRESKERIDTLKQNGMTEQQARDEVEKHTTDLIVLLINEQLLVQKGKELDFTDRVEAEVNKRMLDVAKQNGVNSIEKLTQAMKDNGISYEETRQTMRTEIMKQAVLESEVDGKIFYGLSSDELHRYFDQHSDKFKRAESVDLSELFLSLAGKPAADVKARVDQLVAQLRAGADFVTLAKANSERGAADGGEVGLFEVANLRPDIAAAIKDVKIGDVSDPLKTDEGYGIVRVNARTAGSNTPTFNENQVREAITGERSAKAHDDYLQKLRDEAYIKIAKDYSDTVLPQLKIKQDFIVEKTGDDSEKKPEKKKGRLFGIFPRP